MTVPLAIRVLDVEPDNVIGYVIEVHGGVYCLDICLVPIIPSTLMVAQCKVLWHLRRACCQAILLQDLQHRLMFIPA